MTLVDAGPLVALIDRGEPDHKRCVATLAQLSGPLVPTSLDRDVHVYRLKGRRTMEVIP